MGRSGNDGVSTSRQAWPRSRYPRSESSGGCNGRAHRRSTGLRPALFACAIDRIWCCYEDETMRHACEPRRFRNIRCGPTRARGETSPPSSDPCKSLQMGHLSAKLRIVPVDRLMFPHFSGSGMRPSSEPTARSRRSRRRSVRRAWVSPSWRLYPR